MKYFILIIFIFITSLTCQTVTDTLYQFPDTVTFNDEPNGDCILGNWENLAVKFTVNENITEYSIEKVLFIFPSYLINQSNLRLGISTGSVPDERLLYNLILDIDSSMGSFPNWYMINLDSAVMMNSSVDSNYFYMLGSGLCMSCSSSLMEYFTPNHFLKTASDGWGSTNKYYAVRVVISYNISVINNSNGKLINYSLDQNYPNPFNPSTKINFSLPKPETVTIEVYNIIGQKIQTLLNKSMPAGYHEVEFTGQNLSSGIYLYRIEAGTWTETKKMLLVK